MAQAKGQPTQRAAQKMVQKRAPAVEPIVIWAGIALLSILLFRVAEKGDADLRVYWTAAHDLARGVFPYHSSAAHEGFVFKYPPWILPWFLPLAALNWTATRWAWFCVEWACVFYSIRWVIRAGAPRRWALGVALSFWWIWRAHFEFGQLTCLLLAVSLWACPPERSSSAPADDRALSIRAGIAAFFLSAKVFSVITLAGIARRWKKGLPWIVASGTALASLATVFALDSTSGARKYFSGWLQGASSGGQELGETVIRGLQNHSFTTRLLAAAGVPASQTSWDMAVSSLLALLLGISWWRLSRPLDTAEKWCGWIALGAIAHPIAWDHSYVMAYPLCALAAARAARSDSRPIQWMAGLGIFLVALLVPQLWGADLVRPFELCANKFWGVLLCAGSLIAAGGSNTAVSEAS